MSCRSNPGSSAITSYARATTDLDDAQVQSLFHEEIREAKAKYEGSPHIPADGKAGGFRVRDHMDFVAKRVRADESLSDARKQSITERLEHGKEAEHCNSVDFATYSAWTQVGERARRAERALNEHYRDNAARTGRDEDTVRADAEMLRKEAAADKELTAPKEWVDDFRKRNPDLPGDRATLYAAYHQEQDVPPTPSIESSEAGTAPRMTKPEPVTHTPGYSRSASRHTYDQLQPRRVVGPQMAREAVPGEYAIAYTRDGYHDVQVISDNQDGTVTVRWPGTSSTTTMEKKTEEGRRSYLHTHPEPGFGLAAPKEDADANA